MRYRVGIYLSNSTFSTDLSQYIENSSMQYLPLIIDSIGHIRNEPLSCLITDQPIFNEISRDIKKIRADNADFKLAVLFREINTSDIPRFILSGVDVFLSYADRFQEIIASIHQARQTNSFISPLLIPHFVDYIRDGAFHQDMTGILSKREMEMLQQIMNGETAKEAAAQLSVSVHTINFHLKKIYHKLGIKSKAQLISRFKDHVFEQN